MKTEEDEAFDDLARKQGMWGGGFQAKRAAAADKQEPYDQTALELCEVCGWKTLIPDDGCLNCERAQPAQEPVALVIDGVLVKSELPEKYTGHLYTTPPKREWVEVECPLCGEMAVANTHPNLNKREWVGLTDEEMDAALRKSGILATFEALHCIGKEVEAKLKEKNFD